MKKAVKKKPVHPSRLKQILLFCVGAGLGLFILFTSIIYLFERQYSLHAYPGITVGDFDVSGKDKDAIKKYWLTKNTPLKETLFTFVTDEKIATVSGMELDVGFDATLSATQALVVGRSGNFLTDAYQKYTALTQGLRLQPLFSWKKDVLEEKFLVLSQEINIEPVNALFEFKNGRVIAFKSSKSGRMVDTEALTKRFVEQLDKLSAQASPPAHLVFSVPVVAKEPLITTEQANGFGIVELIGKGESFFRGSIPGRIHNVALSASLINGILVPPRKTFSFNQALGDISAATGYKQAYVIKNGRTVLDDGGGVCQVSTTLFRAALNAGLPIVERHAHSYRVGYYEQGGWKPGFDATVYAPAYDLKITNDTPTHMLITAITDTSNMKLTFELYGKTDGRTVTISPVRLWDVRPAPADLYQDDPTLSVGTVKQVDWSNPGIKAIFDYSVKHGDTETFKSSFYSNYIPWQAVFLRGTGPAQ